MDKKASVGETARTIRRQTPLQNNVAEKIRIVMEGQSGE